MAAKPNPMDPPKGVAAKAIDGLYQGPLEDFTAQRNELAKELRSDGDAAAWVKGLPKPSRAAWLVNRLSVEKADEIGELLSLGKELRAAQEEMLAGSTDREKLRDAAQREQRTVDSLARAAEKIGDGAGAQILTRVAETLQAAAGDPDVAEAIERGRLTREQRAASVGLIGTAAPAARPARKGSKGRQAAERRERQQQAKRRKELERKLATAEKKLDRERTALERAEQKVAEAESRVKDAEHDAHAARRELDAL
jgi:DNA repair exonuclease SbcCD ATPase subunit